MGVGRSLVIALASMIFAGPVDAQRAGELRFCIRADPRTFDPLLAEEDASDTVRYLTGGVLIRFNRETQQLQPELASSWKVIDGARRIDFVVRHNVRFSDGRTFGPQDVVATIRRLADPGMQSGIADSFRSAGGVINAQQSGPDGVSVIFSTPVAGLELLFDQLAISPAGDQGSRTAVLGPFVLREHRGGQYVLLQRNVHYWKTAADGTKRPLLDAVRLEIQANRETELVRFRRGELHMVSKLDADAYDRLRKESPKTARNAGPSLDSEFFWFNLAASAQLPSHKRRWFGSKAFRQAVSAAVNREDIVRLAYRGNARPAVTPVSPANSYWFNRNLTPPKYDPQLALQLLRSEGFRLEGATLRDRDGNAVEFSLITNAGNTARGRIGAMVQQDLGKVGIRIHFSPIEFQSLIERITKSMNYEACLLGLTNVEIDPNAQMNVWMSSGTIHPWNPRQTKPATQWEAEIDQLMRIQHTTVERGARKKAFDRVQELIADLAPVVSLVHPDVLAALSPLVRGAVPSALPPHLFWNVESIWLATEERRRED